ncbi:UNVERIFIED_CONTAM: hypothetical protein K2H54_058704 [Gekko kuhli]
MLLPVPHTMEETIYEEMNPVGTDGVADAEQPIYEEMKPVMSEGSEPLEVEGLYWNLIANLIEICHKPVQENCCAHCREIAYYQECNWLREAAVKKASEKSGQAEEEEEEEDVQPRVYAEYFIEQIGRVRKCSSVAKTFPGKADPYCCTYCWLLSYCQDSDSENDDEEDSGAGTECETSGDSGVNTEPDAVGGVKEPLPSRAQTPEPEEADPTKDDGEKCPCVQALFPDVWDGPVDFTLLASRIFEKINPDCCYHCGLIKLAHKLREGEFGADPGLPKVTLIEIEGKDLCEFLQWKLMDRTEKQNCCREREDKNREKTV